MDSVEKDSNLRTQAFNRLVDVIVRLIICEKWDVCGVILI